MTRARPRTSRPSPTLRDQFELCAALARRERLHPREAAAWMFVTLEDLIEAGRAKRARARLKPKKSGQRRRRREAMPGFASFG